MIASTVATNVLGTVRTTSPRPMPAAMSANLNASVPLPTPTQYFASQNRANSRSNASKTGPPINIADVSTPLAALISSSCNSRCGVTKSKNGIPFPELIQPPCWVLRVPENTGRVTGNNCVWWNIFRHDGTCADEGVFTDYDVCKDRGARTDGGALAYAGAFDFPIRFGL